MGLRFEDQPIPPTTYGRALYERGRRLVADHGVRLDALLWDADEVLWDWLLSGWELLSILPRAAASGYVGHREWLLPRAGMLELIWGMRHESLERGLDAHMRIWTSGYPWRMWRITQEIPGFAELIGPPYDASEAGAEAMGEHPRIFTRTDYVRAMTRLFDNNEREPLLATHAPHVRALIEQHMINRARNSGLKIPELAALAGKPELATGRVLIDDTTANVQWFVQTGRGAIHVQWRTPRIFLRSVPNSAWNPEKAILELGSSTAGAIADALTTLGDRNELVVARGEPMEVEYKRPFMIDIPSEVVQGQWIKPIRAMVRGARAR